MSSLLAPASGPAPVDSAGRRFRLVLAICVRILVLLLLARWDRVAFVYAGF